MKFTADAVRQTLTGAPKLMGRPTQGTLWVFKRFLLEALRRIHHPDHGLKGWAPYLRTTEEQAFTSTIVWTEPADVGKYFDPP